MIHQVFADKKFTNFWETWPTCTIQRSLICTRWVTIDNRSVRSFKNIDVWRDIKGGRLVFRLSFVQMISNYQRRLLKKTKKKKLCERMFVLACVKEKHIRGFCRWIILAKRDFDKRVALILNYFDGKLISLEDLKGKFSFVFKWGMAL